MNLHEPGFFALPVCNLETAKKFYGDLMGWEFRDRDPAFSYIVKGESLVGCVEAARDDFQPSAHGTRIYFELKRMGEFLEKAKASGGVIAEQCAVEGGAKGHTARVNDPFGNTLGFWAPQL